MAGIGRGRSLPQFGHLLLAERAVLEQHPPDQAIATLDLTEDVFLRSFTWVRVELGTRYQRTGLGSD